MSSGLPVSASSIWTGSALASASDAEFKAPAPSTNMTQDDIAKRYRRDLLFFFMQNRSERLAIHDPFTGDQSDKDQALYYPLSLKSNDPCIVAARDPKSVLLMMRDEVFYRNSEINEKVRDLKYRDSSLIAAFQCHWGTLNHVRPEELLDLHSTAKGFQSSHEISGRLAERSNFPLGTNDVLEASFEMWKALNGLKYYGDDAKSCTDIVNAKGDVPDAYIKLYAEDNFFRAYVEYSKASYVDLRRDPILQGALNRDELLDGHLFLSGFALEFGHSLDDLHKMWRNRDAERSLRKIGKSSHPDISDELLKMIPEHVRKRMPYITDNSLVKLLECHYLNPSQDDLRREESPLVNALIAKHCFWAFDRCQPVRAISFKAAAVPNERPLAKTFVEIENEIQLAIVAVRLNMFKDPDETNEAVVKLRNALKKKGAFLDENRIADIWSKVDGGSKASLSATYSRAAVTASLQSLNGYENLVATERGLPSGRDALFDLMSVLTSYRLVATQLFEMLWSHLVCSMPERAPSLYESKANANDAGATIGALPASNQAQNRPKTTASAPATLAEVRSASNSPASSGTSASSSASASREGRGL